MKPSEILFSINRYDKDGDCFEKGVFLHFGKTTIKAADSIKEFSEIVDHFREMVNEIEENYDDE